MAKRYNHQALAEAIKQGQARMKRTMMEPKESDTRPTEQPVQPEKKRAFVGLGTIPSLRKKPLRINRGYFVFAAVIIGLILVVYWVGNTAGPQPEPQTETVETAITQPDRPLPSAPAPARPATRETATRTPAPSTQSPAPADRAETAAPSGPEKDHVIVIATYTKREHLLPAQEYFDKNGVRTEILRRGSYYLLVTSGRFDSPLKSGTDGRRMLETIKTLGRQYQAPDGYENFGRTPFQDAYGMKVKN